jgi:hypothetical protein
LAAVKICVDRQMLITRVEILNFFIVLGNKIVPTLLKLFSIRFKNL